MRLLAALVSLSLVVTAPGAAAAVQLGRGSVSGKIPTLTGPYKPQVRTGPFKLDSLKVSGSLENSLHVIDPVLRQKVAAITPNLVEAAKPLDEKQPVELGLSRSSLLFDNAKSFSDKTAVYAADARVRSFGLARNTGISGAAKAAPVSWGAQARELRRLKAEAKSIVGKKIKLLAGTIVTATSWKLLTLYLGYWGLGIASAAVLFIGGKLLQLHLREKAGRREAWVLAQQLKGGAPNNLEVVALVDDVRPALESILAQGTAPEHETRASELRQFLAEVETGDRKNWSLTAAATNLLGTADPLIDAYRHSLWDKTGRWEMEYPEFVRREEELARLIERLTAAAEVGDRTTRDLRFLASRVPRGSEDRNIMAMLWKLGVLEREVRKTRDAALIAAFDEVSTRFVKYSGEHFMLQPTADAAEALLKAIDAAIHARRRS